MPWKKQSGSSGQGSWGGGRSPDLEDILRRSRAQMRRMLPGGFGSGRSSPSSPLSASDCG